MTASDPKAAPRILLVDGTNSLYRAFFAIPNLRAPDGSPTNAAYGFVNMLAKVVREEEPDYTVVVFDPPGKTFRHEIYDGYKAGRDATPEDLRAQIPMVRELVEAHGIPIVSIEGFEADDVIATLVKRAPSEAETVIVSTDKDLMQLVDDRVTLLDGMKDRRTGPAEVEERFGVAPEKVLDYRALVGDPSDNIPGVKGIGAKGAAKLIDEWGDLDNLLEHAEEVSATRARNALRDNADSALLSRKLATLRDDVPIPLEWEDAKSHPPDASALRPLYERLGFTRLLANLDGGDGESAAASETEVDVVADAGALDGLIESLRKQDRVHLVCVFGDGGPLEGDLAGIAFATDDAAAAFVPVSTDALALGDVLQRLEPLLAADGGRPWVADDAKHAQMLFAENGSEIGEPAFDVRVAAHLIDPSGAKSLAAIAAQHLDRKLPSWEDLAGRGAKATPAGDLPVAALADWAAQQVTAVRALHEPLARRLEKDGLEPLFREVELPLTTVLAAMERTGVRIDEEGLGELAEAYEADLAAIEKECHSLAGEEFNIGSPKQLQQILFEKLKLPPIKKTKTGYSTDESVLEQLAVDHELPARVLAYRRLSKLLSTYVVALPPLVSARTGRIHPTFHQLGAATGRLSAQNPNVQNIPIRSPEGVRIREMFIPAEGCRLLSADYSQVELRILAHFSEDEGLLEAFGRGDDIHRQTAAEVNGIDPDDVTAEQRARAKAVNFGIIYGLSSYGLANQLGIASAEAQATIDAYFERYQGVRRFLDETIESARENGYVVTVLGRRRYLPDLGSKNRALRTAAERMATNTVIQGSAADLIKKAMVELHDALREQESDARMILQVHDELVFEVPKAAVKALVPLVRERMEAVLPLRVPLVVDIGVGENWREAH